MKIQQVKPNTEAIREIVIPIKKHLAKFILFNDWDKLIHPEFFAKSILFVSYRRSKIWGDSFPSHHLSQILSESIKNKNWFVSVNYNRIGSKSKSNETNIIFKNNYLLVKIKVHISSTPYIKQKDNSYRDVVKAINNYFESVFDGFCYTYIELHPVKIKAIDEIYTLFRIDNNDLKKETLKRRYYRQK